MLLKSKEAETLFDRGINYFRGGFYLAALQEFIALKRFDPDYPNIDFIIEAASKKKSEVAGKLSNFIEDNFTDEIDELSKELKYSNSRSLIQEIEALMLSDKPFEALQKLESIDNVIPDSRSLLLLKANTYRRMGNIDEAEVTLERANRLYPDDFEILKNLGSVYMTKCAYDSAAKAFEKANNIKSDDFAILNNIGSLKMQMNCLDDACKYFRKANKQKPNWKVAKRNLENVKIRIDALDKEIDELRKELGRHPNYLDIALNLGKSLYFRGYFSEARRTLEKLISQNDNILAAYFYLGMLHEHDERIQEAITYYEKMVVKSNKSDLPAFKNYKDLYNQGYLKEALAELKKIAVIDLDLAASRIELGIKYFEDCMWEDALRHFQKAVQINDTYPDGFYWIALSYIQMNNRKKAIEAFNKAIEIKNDYADAHFQLGMLLRKRAKKKARQHLEKALKLNVRSSFALIARKIIYEQK